MNAIYVLKYIYKKCTVQPLQFTVGVQVQVLKLLLLQVQNNILGVK